jgi:WD40 repeat protein
MQISIAKITQFSGHLGSIYSMVRSFDAKWVYSSGGDGYVVRWEMQGQEDGFVVAKVGEPVYCLYLLNEKSLLIGTAAGNLILIDLDSYEIIKKVALESGSIFSMIEFNSKLMVGTQSGELIEMTLDIDSITKRNKVSEKSVRTLCEFKGSLFWGSSDNSIGVYRTDGQFGQMIDGAHDNSVFSLIKVNNTLWSGGRDARIKIWDGNSVKKEIVAHSGHVNSMDYNENNGLVISGSMDKSVKIWNADSGELLKVLSKEKMKFHVSSVNKVLWIGPNEFISCADDRILIKTIITFI